jgi:hypothetical protein
MTGMRRALVVGLLVLLVGCGKEGGAKHVAAVATPSPPVGTVTATVPEPSGRCKPSAAMRRAAPTLDQPPDRGGVPEIVRRSVRSGFDSGIAAKYARAWGRTGEITYWIVPHLRCERSKTDAVCVTPVKASYSEASSACVKPGRTGSIHFPDGGASAIAGFAPAHAREAVVRVKGQTVVLEVKDHVFAGRLQIPLKGEVGPARIEYR